MRVSTIKEAKNGLNSSSIMTPSRVKAAIANAIKDIEIGGTGGGDVTGPASSVASDIVLFDGSSGKIIKDSGKKLTDYQVAGTYSTDIHSNITALNNVSGANSGDESASTIKTKLGITTLSGSNTGDQIAATVPYTDTTDYETTTVQEALDTALSALGSYQTAITNLDIYKADKTNVLGLDNITAFTPDANYEPATKKYVDDNKTAAQIQSDWNQTTNTALDYIKNKPTIPTMPTRDTLELGTEDTVTFANLSGTNTGDQDATDFDIKDLTDSTSLRSTWSGKQDALGFTPEATSNKVTSISGASTDAQYPSAKLLFDQLAGKQASGSYEVTPNKKTDLTDNSDTYYPSQKAVKTAVDGKVDRITGKGLSTEDYTTTEKSKLSGIADGAEVNVQPDWNQATITADDYIKNKPTIPSAYTLPTASTTTLGGVKIDGTTVTISDGVISSTGGTVPTKATGAEIDTGTDDAKFATAKAIADSKLIFETDITDNLASTSTTNPLSANQGRVLNESNGYLIATAGSNGDFYITSLRTLTTGMIMDVLLPAATINTASARFGIGGSGGTFINMKYLRGLSTIQSSLVENNKVRIYYDGTNWIIDSKIVAIYKFDSATKTTGDITVNSNLDGGIYEISVFGASASSGELSMYINGVTTATDYYYQRMYVSGTSVSAETANRATAGYMYTSSSLNNLFVSLANGFAISSGLTSISTGNNIEALNYFWKYKTAISNITSIRFTMGANFVVGTKVIICKKC